MHTPAKLLWLGALETLPLVVVAFAVALLTRHLFLTIVAGLACFALLGLLT